MTTSSGRQYSRTYKAKYEGKCQLCEKKVYVDQFIVSSKQGGVAHSKCVEKRRMRLTGTSQIRKSDGLSNFKRPDGFLSHSSTDVVSLVKSMFSVEISTNNSYFSSNGWTYKTQVSVECADCVEGDFLHVFRKNTSLNRPKSKRNEFWCLVCLVCKNAVALSEYDNVSIALIKDDYILKVTETRSTNRTPRKRSEWVEVDNQRPPITRSAIRDSLMREELRHKERAKSTSKFETNDQIDQGTRSIEPFRSMSGHELYVYQSAGVRSQNRALEPWSGHCSCGFWDLIAGDPTGLLMNWTLHVREHEEHD